MELGNPANINIPRVAAISLYDWGALQVTFRKKYDEYIAAVGS